MCLAIAVARIGDLASQLTHGIMGLAMAAGYLIWHVWTCAEHTRAPGAGPTSTVATRRSAVRAAPVAHAVTSAAMAAMFLGVT